MDRYDFSQLINNIKEVETVDDVIVDEKTDIEIYDGNKVSKSVLIDILQEFPLWDKLVQEECESDTSKYQYAPAWIKVSENKVVIGYWGITVNSNFDKVFVKVDDKWKMSENNIDEFGRRING